jgi:hypothetical protein
MGNDDLVELNSRAERVQSIQPPEGDARRVQLRRLSVFAPIGYGYYCGSGP